MYILCYSFVIVAVIFFPSGRLGMLRPSNINITESGFLFLQAGDMARIRKAKILKRRRNCIEF